jgi:hypothetical protein
MVAYGAGFFNKHRQQFQNQNKNRKQKPKTEKNTGKSVWGPGFLILWGLSLAWVWVGIAGQDGIGRPLTRLLKRHTFKARIETG